MEIISVSYLIAIGILLIGLEAIIPSFVIIWLGIGFLIVAVGTFFGIFENGYSQIATAFGIGLLLVALLRNWAMNLIMKSEDNTEEKVHNGGIGTISEGTIKLNGTFWQTDSDLSKYKNGDKVKVKIDNNKAIIEEK